MEELEQHLGQIPEAEKYQSAMEAREDPRNMYLYIDSVGTPRWKNIPENIVFFKFDNLGTIKQLEKHSIYKAHIQIPLGLLPRYLLDRRTEREIEKRIKEARGLIESIYPAIAVGGFVTITEYLVNEFTIQDLLKESGFVPITNSITPAGVYKNHILIKLFATKP